MTCAHDHDWREFALGIALVLLIAALSVGGKAACTARATGMPYGNALWFTLAGGEIRATSEER